MKQYMKNWKKNIVKYLFELLIVAFGVFLGIYVSEWNSKKHINENTSKSMNFIIEEMKSNQKNLLKSIEYHELIKSNLRKITKQISEHEISKPYFGNKAFHVSNIEGWAGIGLSKFRTISFEGAKMNSIFQEMDFEIVQQIASAYKQIEFNQEFGTSVLDKMLQTNSTTKVVDVIGIVELLTSDVLNSEKALNLELEHTIEYLKKYETRKKTKPQ